MPVSSEMHRLVIRFKLIYVRNEFLVEYYHFFNYNIGGRYWGGYKIGEKSVFAPG